MIGAHPKSEVFVATGLMERLRGLAPFDPSCDSTIVLVPCRDIHTLGMKSPIDVAFADEGGNIVASYRNVAPRRRLRCPNALFTLERYASRRAWYEVGDTVFRSTGADALRREGRFF